MTTVSAEEQLASLQTSMDFLFGRLELARQLANAPVPSCPGWDIAALYRHLGSVQEWVHATLQLVGSQERPAPRTEESAPGSDPFDAFSKSAPQLLWSLEHSNPDLPSWNFGPPPRLAAFWFRRQNMEHLVHVEDLAQAMGQAAPEIPESIALDGVDEVLSVLLPQRVRAGMLEYPAAVRFEAGSASWQVGEGEPQAVLLASPSDLFLGLWRRRPLLELAEISGDSQILERLLEADLVP
ncbi:maleylpyruvate isomerase family mycothiol-dependent enzyme [Psychromicrobium lacuslunae]|uniref:Mycothiol-dependent maleylpyruvate isomerase metal-binding domain-containing protein n=1 Tax=Psychromicrobium lacuslunae TaxID=1618207 RepID=A0A0D4BWZ6_9MICC|nr:maleylpyruvate isomerase family mycothiol-dependent enzyme [Psychromicrobium lacuslunae]AJT40987.1 hypothetical protein UM93_04735 [Psychromicrobium lacuslunae]